jgi:hypothetical protein
MSRSRLIGPASGLTRIGGMNMLPLSLMMGRSLGQTTEIGWALIKKIKWTSNSGQRGIC